MIKSTRYSFARQFLQERDIQIYAAGKRVLLPLKVPIYRTYQLKTGFWVGDTFLDRPEIVVIRDYKKVKNLGFCVSTAPVEDRTRFRQRVMYILMRDRGQEDVKEIPKLHWIEYDPEYRQARIVGPNTSQTGHGPWVSAAEKFNTAFKIAHTKIKINQYRKYAAPLQRAIKSSWVDLPEERIFIKIKEIPIMISEHDEIVCIPQTSDEHTIGIFGQRRSGKSFMLNAIIGRMFWTPGWDKRFVILNDSQSECGPWCQPNRDKKLYYIMKKINQIPLPMPCVYLYPHLRDTIQVLNGGECTYQMSLPYEEIIRNYEKYMKLDKTAKYFKEIIDELIERCQNVEDVEELLEEKKGRIDKGSANKILAYMKSIFTDEVSDRSSGVPATWIIKEGEKSYEYNPLTALMIAGAVPVFETRALQSYDFFQPYFRYFVEDIFNRQIEDSLFRRKNISVYFFIDELHTVSSTEQKGVADQILKRVVKEGGPRRIGAVIADQNFSKINSLIRSNIKYIINFSNPEEASIIARTYNLGKNVANEIKELKKFECLAVATDEEFVVYTRDGKNYKTKGPIKGRSLPPLSEHKKPGEENNA